MEGIRISGQVYQNLLKIQFYYFVKNDTAFLWDKINYIKKQLS